MTNTIVTNEKAALGTAFGNGHAQNGLEVAEQVYCEKHGLVKGWHGQCEECLDEGFRDFDATRIAKSLIPDWTGIKTDGRKVFVARVRDAVEAVEKISLYKNSDALVLLIWDSLVTALDKGRIGPSWTVQSLDEILEVECVACGQPFAQTWRNEQICESCALGEL